MAKLYSEDRESQEHLISGTDEESFSEDTKGLRERKTRWGRYQINGFVALTLWTFILIFASIYLWVTATRRSQVPVTKCDDYIPIYSPALISQVGTGHVDQFDGSFAKQNRYKGPASPAIDEGWDDITFADGGVINVDEETFNRVNASEYSVKLADEIGGGYMGSVEALHQLHCLNMLRQASYEDYYRDKPGPWEDSPEILRFHLDHCIDILRQKLMCDADAGILTYIWVEGHKEPFPDFNVHHQCRDFRALKEWVRDHQLYTTPEHGIERLPGAPAKQTPP
ncbi:hypothetical protein N7454_006293 [Penicillium verhagenii]|nr:hypothetical protein N7454_006293 [Penicillium verhagenii]